MSLMSDAFIRKGKALAICWKFNRKDGCENTSCSFVHVCQRSMGKHAYVNCPQVKRGAKEVAASAN